MDNQLIDSELIDNNIKTIAEQIIPYNITLQHINNVNNIRQTLHITIFNNKIYLIDGLKGEERHANIIKQIFNILKKFTIPNITLKFMYCDTVNVNMAGLNSCVFSHSNCTRDNFEKKILAPCFSFESYSSTNNFENETYSETMTNIIKESKKYTWDDKEKSIVFKGYLDYPHRKQLLLDLNNKIKKCELLLCNKIQPQAGRFQNSYGSLCKYRYQLLLNGYGDKLGNEAGSIRPKYMLATGSICIYITFGIDVKECWMLNNNFNHIIVCNNVDDAIKQIEYFENNPEVAKEHIKKQMEFVETYLNNDSIELLWFHLLNTYSQRCNFTIDSPSGNIIEENNIDTIVKSLI
jgi:hypothetical protein